MEPGKYFLALEPDPVKRIHLIGLIRHILTPRTDATSIVVVQGPPKSGRTTLINLLMGLVGFQAVKLDRTDVVRTWRMCETHKMYPLRFVLIPSLKDQDLDTLPLLTDDPQPVLVGEKWISPSFRYLVERGDEPLDVSAYLKYHHVLTLPLRYSFDDGSKIKFDIPEFRAFLGL